ncbi:MAG: hypothetical protein R3F50_19045 [Gammaproteobacteria bacterium]
MKATCKPSGFLCLVLLSLAGCQTPLKLGDLADSLIPGGDKVTAPLPYYDWSQQATGEQLIEEQRRLESLVQLYSDPVSRIQLDIVRMALGNAALTPIFADLGSLQRDCQTRSCEDYVRLGAVLNQLATTQKSLDLARSEQNQGQNDQATLQAELSRLQQRIAGLEAQIDALTSLEQEIIQRELYELPR